MPKKQSQEVAWPDLKFFGELADRCSIQKAHLDEAHSACDRRRRATPCRAAGCGLRSTPQTRAEAGPLRRGRGGKELHVFRLRRAHRTNWSAVNACGPHTGKEYTVISGISREPGTVTDLPIEAWWCRDQHSSPKVFLGAPHW